MTNSDLRTLPHQQCTEFKNSYNLHQCQKPFFFQTFPAVASGEEEKENDEDDKEESLDDTVVDPEEVNVNDKLMWDYMCFIHCYVRVK